MSTCKVLDALLADPGAELYGREIADRTGLLPGSTYPILLRLHEAGWVSARWEELAPNQQGRARRRYYQLTDVGIAAAREAVGAQRSAPSRTLRLAPRGTI